MSEIGNSLFNGYKETDEKQRSNEGIRKTKVKFWTLMKYASVGEKWLLFVGIIMSCGVGSSVPVTLLFFSDIVDATNSTLVHWQFPDLMESLPGTLARIIERIAITGGITFLVAFLQMLCLQTHAKMQASRIRLLLYKKILDQDASWFDEQSVGDLITKLTERITQIESGIGVKLGIFIQCIIVFVSGLIIVLIRNWRLALVGCATFLPIVIAFPILGHVTQNYANRTTKAYERANSIAGEALGAIRTIFAFDGQKSEQKRYSSQLDEAEKCEIQMSFRINAVLGMSEAFIHILIAVTFYYGIFLWVEGISNPGDIILVAFTMLFSAIAIGQAFVQTDSFNNAMHAAGEIFPIIDRIPSINKSTGGCQLPFFQGEIKFQDVHFSYPTRRSATVLNGLTLEIKSGQTVALVGANGSGKSTVIQLVQRYYDVDQGKILIDGHDISELNVAWLRDQIGVVSQEPVLFAGTVTENIKLGAPNATLEEVKEAAKQAFVHDFICKLPQGYNTYIGEGSGVMSGGQKQLLAIARALIRKPRILLLDEVTSTLDRRSEMAVQRAIENAKVGRTVVMVTHRLSTVRNADVIIVVNRGRVVETGNHNELMGRNGGVYAKLVKIIDGNGAKSAESRVRDSEDEDDDSGEVGVYQNLKVGFSQASDDTSSIGEDNLDENIVVNAQEIKKMTHPERRYRIAGTILSFISAGVQISFAILITEIYDIFPAFTRGEMLSRTAVLSVVLAVLGVVRFLCRLAEGHLWGVAGARFTKRCRTKLFEAILHQEVGWFDDSKNQPGTLIGCLAADVPALQNIFNRYFASTLEIELVVFVTTFVAFIYFWLASLIAVAFLLVYVIVEVFCMPRMVKDGNNANVKGAALAFESLSAAKTIFSLGAEKQFVRRFEEEALPTKKKAFTSSIVHAAFNAFANSLPIFQMAAVFQTCAFASYPTDFPALFRAYTAITFVTQQFAYLTAFTPDSAKAQEAAKRIFAIISRTPKLRVDEGEFPDASFKGNIIFENVHFRYPTQKKVEVLQGFNYSVTSGKSVALVGQPGCGKSAVLQLVQRFYDPTQRPPVTSGRILFDQKDIRELAPTWIRRQIGVVSQEPNLLNLTIAENIAYGLTYLDTPTSMEQIIEAAKQANAHEFIIKLPLGYNTPVGPRGSQLSSGQKQRVAIARALIRNPPLLVLDKATAALDNESERVVQAALDKAMQGGRRTTLVVAHRLTTVKNCHSIAVLEGGRCVESGTHSALMEAKGAYYSLYSMDAKTNIQ